MTKRIRRRFLRWIVVIVIIGTWFSINQPLKFGLHCFGFTVYSGIPFPAVDVMVRANGIPWFRSTKSHEVTYKELNTLIGPNTRSWPDVVVIGTGYEDVVEVNGSIFVETGIQVEVLPTPKALERFNELRSQGKRVAAIIHSTC